MTILRANLKHFYQFRALWLWYFIMLCQIPLAVMPIINNKFNRFFGYLILSFFVGIVVFSLQQDILAKPFSFCMPGHRKVSRKAIMLIGAILNGILGMVFLAYPGITFPYSLLVAIAGGCVGMTIYLLSVRIMAKGQQGNVWLGLSPLYILGIVILDYDKVIQEAMVSNPFIFMAIGSIICWLMWRWLGQDTLARKLCGEIVPGMFDGWNARKMQKIRQAQIQKKMGDKVTGLQSRLEEFFISKMQGYKFLSQNRYSWGQIYADLGPVSLFLKPSALLTLIGILLYFGYCNTNNFSLSQMVFLLPAIGALNMKLPACPSMLLPGGRHERFTGVLSLAFFNTIIAGVAMIILTVMSHLIEPLLPPIHIKMFTLHYQAMDIGKFYLFLLIIPIAFSLTVIIRRRLILKMLIAMALMQIIIFWNIFNKNLEITIPPVVIPIAVIASWLIFVMVTHHFCMKRCLVSQTKG